ncbi:hypothetical protein LWF01_04055 [Saxibacter everestensis]|uniref:Glycosyltransferase RgtA/B/C/D-like domain-containing protein n=1 Tax=Saxibacter everestensis TaxID=2909229 RepID=A0ABY8QXF1_9MICO|nr:hypothetical protein LWF01_04055 [Brevibacteriaceae bacterium ZFBP1038]
MSNHSNATVSGIRGWWTDAIGAKWTLAVTFLTYGLASAWFTDYLTSGRYPVESFESSLANLHILNPYWLTTGLAWYEANGLALLPYLWPLASLLFLLGATSKADSIQPTVGLVLTLLAVDAAKSLMPVVWVLVVISALCIGNWGLKRLQQNNSPRDRSEPTRRSSSRIFIDVLLAVVAPIGFLFMVCATLSNCFYYPPRSESWSTISSLLKQLEDEDSVQAKQARISILMQLLNDDDVVDRSMIKHVIRES